MPRVALGCMRLSTDPDRDEARALATIVAALDAGATWLDTARAYAWSDAELGHNERLVARALDSRAGVRVVTKCGMSRPDGRWEPDGRSRSIIESARASARDLGRPPDVLLLHAPDPRVPLLTSVRGLVRAKEAGLVRAIGLSNVTRGQLESLPEDVDLAAVEVSLGAYDDAAARGGVVAWCQERDVTVLAHAPLGGPPRASRLERDAVLRAIAARHPGVTPAMVVIAYLLAVSGVIVPVVGARRPETARAVLAAGNIMLDDVDLAKLDARFPGLAMVRRPMRPLPAEAATAEVVIVMGVAGSGKSRLAESFVARGYERLNRDTLGGTLAGIAKTLDQRLAGGAKQVVLDNTYVTRASRSEVVRIAHARGAVVRCIHIDAPQHEAQVNVAWRMLERHGELLGGVELVKRAKRDAGLFAPAALSRMARQLELPAADEGFSSIERITFAREHSAAPGASGVALPIEMLLEERGGTVLRRADAGAALARVPRSAPILLYGWRHGADESWRAAASSQVEGLASDRIVEIGVCSHAAGPPVCWCRPPLPGLWLAFARRHGVDPRVSLFVTVTPAHRAMARALGIQTIDEI